MQKLEVYEKLLNVQDISKTTVPELAQRIGISASSLSGMLTQMKKNPKIREDLALAGYTNAQIPPWVAVAATPVIQPEAATHPAPATHPDPDAGPLATPAPAGNPAPIAVRASENQTDQVRVGQARADQGRVGQTPLQNAFDAANKVLEPGGQHIESLGSDALENWVRENAVEKINDTYYQRRVLPSGETALVPTKPPAEVMEAERMGNAEISQMMIRNLEGETAALIKKVAFNPEAFTYYSWAKRKHYLDKDNDFADFVNYCITLTMTKIFGARIGVVVDTDNTLIAQILYI